MKKFLALVAVVIFGYFVYNDFFETEKNVPEVVVENASDSSIFSDTISLDTIPKDTTNK